MQPEEKTVTHEVVVHKANVSLMKGESLRDYISKVSNAGRQHLMKKLNLGNKVAVYMVEAFSDAAVFNVYRYDDNAQSDKINSYYAVPYKRKDDGTFEMGEATEVISVTRFEPKKVPISKSSEKTFGNEVSTWKETEKSFWKGAL